MPHSSGSISVTQTSSLSLGAARMSDKALEVSRIHCFRFSRGCPLRIWRLATGIVLLLGLRQPAPAAGVEHQAGAGHRIGFRSEQQGDGPGDLLRGAEDAERGFGAHFVEDVVGSAAALLGTGR